MGVLLAGLTVRAGVTVVVCMATAIGVEVDRADCVGIAVGNGVLVDVVVGIGVGVGTKTQADSIRPQRTEQLNLRKSCHDTCFAVIVYLQSNCYVLVRAKSYPDSYPKFPVHININSAHGNLIEFSDAIVIRIALTLSGKHSDKDWKITEYLFPSERVLVFIKNMNSQRSHFFFSFCDGLDAKLLAG
ncbi:MAG: hypothetical protein KGJ80_11620 [Chloroflexota bacterium]|nr:hypothetical protein [Chloroflexota bacterium]